MRPGTQRNKLPRSGAIDQSCFAAVSKGERLPLPRRGRQVARMGVSKERAWSRDRRARGIHPGRTPEADPGLEKGEEGTPKTDLRVGRPVASPRFSRPGLIGRGASSRLDHRSSGPSAGPPLAERPSGCLSALRARPARSGRGADVFGPSPSGAFRAPAETLQSRRPPESDATERPPRDRLPSACMTRCARGSSPEGSGGRAPWMGIDVKDYFLGFRAPQPATIFESLHRHGRARPGHPRLCVLTRGLRGWRYACVANAQRLIRRRTARPRQSRGCPGQARA